MACTCYWGNEVVERGVSMGEKQRSKRTIIMDLDLPILDGIAATNHIRQQSEMNEVPIYTRVRAFARGCNEYMAKPEQNVHAKTPRCKGAKRIDLKELEQLLIRYLPGD
jgi:CheY-like chemotaxis protein